MNGQLLARATVAPLFGRLRVGRGSGLGRGRQNGGGTHVQTSTSFGGPPPDDRRRRAEGGTRITSMLDMLGRSRTRLLEHSWHQVLTALISDINAQVHHAS